MSTEIKKHLVSIITSSIQSLEKDKATAEKINSRKAEYNVIMWSQDLDYSIDKTFTGSISNVIKKAESEFKENNKIEYVNPDVFNINIIVNDKRYQIPEKLWQQYRNKL
ncbi:MAG: hypothetical protein ACP5NW_05790 [Candidatus Woesearchaeota archaeon]